MSVLRILLACGCLISAAALAGNSVGGTVFLVDQAGEALPNSANFVVFVEGIDPASRSALLNTHSEGDPPHISHKGQAFSPRVLVITTGTTVDFKNDDRIYHNAFSLSKQKTFDLGIYPEGTSKFVTFEQPGLVRVYCNMHPDMISNILVLDNPYFSVTRDDGNYRIDDLPNGTFSLRVWAENAGELERRVVITGDQAVIEDFTATARPQFDQHKNKFGKPYRDKY